MRIAIICTLYPPYILGGAEISISLLAKSIAEIGHEVIVITTGKSDCKERVDGIWVHRLKNKNLYWRFPQREKHIIRKSLWHFVDMYNPLYKGKIRRILEDFHPDIVNTSNLCGLSVSTWNVINSMKIPIVHTLRDYYLLCPRQSMIKGTSSCKKQCTICKFYSISKKRESKKVDAVIGISDFISQFHLRFNYFPNAKVVRTIANSVSTSRVEKERIINNTIGYIGRLSPEKGIEFLIESFNRSIISHTHKLLIAGSGNYKYEEKLKARYSSSTVIFIGNTKQSVFFNMIDLLVVPSLWNEPFGRVVIESYAYHRPVLLSSNGGLKELQVDGISWFFDTDNQSSLIKLLDEYATKKLICNNDIFDTVIPKYNEKIIADQYLSLFEDIVSKKY